MIHARHFTDRDIVAARARAPIAPAPSRFNAFAWTAILFFATGWGLGLLCGLAR